MRKLRKPLSILLSLVMVLGMFAIVPITVSAQAAITYTEYSWKVSALVMVDRTVTDYTVVDSNLSTMTSGTYVVNSDTTIENYVTVQKGATANLVVTDGVTLTCKKGIGCGLNKNNEYASLNIFGTGKIVATGKSKVAGIGGDDNEANGNITIHGTTIEATGGKHGAGIGGGEGGKDPDASSPTITIYDGNITATGGIDGAGIGGDEQPGARTYIYGGTIDASSEKHGAGIGGGDEEGSISTAARSPQQAAATARVSERAKRAAASEALIKTAAASISAAVPLLPPAAVKVRVSAVDLMRICPARSPYRAMPRSTRPAEKMPQV